VEALKEKEMALGSERCLQVTQPYLIGNAFWDTFSRDRMCLSVPVLLEVSPIEGYE